MRKLFEDIRQESQLVELQEEIGSLTSEELEAVVGGVFLQAGMAVGDQYFEITADKDGYAVSNFYWGK